MGRSRRRERRAGVGPGAAPRSGGGHAPTRSRREGALDRLERPRRTLALHLGGALVTAVLVLAGTVVLIGSLGPWIVLAAAAALAYLLHSWSSGRLEGMELTDEDRILKVMASGLLVMSVAFALIAAIILTFA
jgi:hypothetical protein